MTDRYIEITRNGLMFYGLDNKKYYLINSRIYQEVKTKTGGLTVRHVATK